jgi:hypothetical protein
MNQENSMTIRSFGSVPRALRRVGLLTVAIVACTLGAATAASAATGFVDSFTLERTGPQAQIAGGHPDVTTSTRFVVDPTGGASGEPSARESAKTVDVDLPVGMVGNPNSAPTCPEYRLLRYNCPPAAQVGTIAMYNSNGGYVQRAPLYNETPAGGATAQFGFSIAGAVLTRITASVLPGDDYRVRMRLVDLPSQYTDISGLDVTFWGVPADSSHNHERYQGPFIPDGGTPAGVDRTPFLTNPVECDGSPAATTARFNSWQHPSTFVDMQSTEPPLTGCEGLRFDPTIEVQPTTTQAGAPTGLRVGLTFPQDENPDGVGTSRLKRASVQLPEGMVLSPSAANGLTACTDAELGVGSTEPDRCPAASKVGTVAFDSPLLDQPLTGEVFVGKPLPGNMFRLFLSAFSTGVRIKQIGTVTPDPVTGQLTTTFEDTPQLPAANITLSLFGGPRAVLSNPRTCGAATTTAALRGYGVANDATVRSTFAVTGCQPARFAPTFSAGTSNPLAGAFSPFTTTIARDDADQDLSQISMQLPPGLLSDIGSMPFCPGAAADAGTCDESTRIGTTTVTAGPGPNPYALQGPVYLSGPLRGAPFSLSVVVRAVAGPYDLGTVVVRGPITVDAKTAQVSVVTDPLPTILAGVPVQLRSVSVALDRPRFMFNPTNCTSSAVTADVRSVAGTTAHLSNRFQAANCATLPYRPKLTLKVGGKLTKGQTSNRAVQVTNKKVVGAAAKASKVAAVTPSEMRDGGHPEFSAHLVMGPGEANQRRVTVTLPLSLALDPDNANALCEPSDAAADRCPAASIVGQVHARSPILRGTLNGRVYFVRGERTDPKSGRIIKTLPRLYVPLFASDYPGVQINLYAFSEVKANRLVTTFDNIPDTPVSEFDLSIAGGKHGILAVSGTNLCASAQYADAEFLGQNNRRLTSRIGLETSCPLAVVGSSHSATALSVRLGGLAAGKVTVSGNGITKAAKTINASSHDQSFVADGAAAQTVAATSNATIVAALSRSVRSRLAHGHNVKIRVTVSFTPKGSRKTTKTSKTLIVHGTRTKK